MLLELPVLSVLYVFSEIRAVGRITSRCEEIEGRGVFSDTGVPGRIDAFRSEHRARIYYDIDRPGRDLAYGMHDLAEEVHAYVVEFAAAQSRCSCDGE